VKAFLYARVSTGEQNEGMQVREMLEFAARSKWEPEVFTDSISGAKEKRPGLDSMMALVRRRKCDVVLVYKFDRFARSLSHLLRALEEFQALDVAFVSLHDHIDTTTPTGKLMFQIVGAFAEFEREIIRQRVLSGVAHARAQGIRLGRPRIAVDVEKIALLRAQGVPWREIGKRLGISHAQAIRALRQAGTKSSISEA
jgi:DNA invertase Pin-like site-specific DNA recombinase